MTSQEKLNLVTNYFSEDWAIKKAMQLLEDYENAQQPAPSAAVALSDDLRDRLVAISEAVADQDDRAAQAMLREILKAPQPTHTPQADSVLEDAARLDWLLLRISGAEFRRIGVHYSGNASRADVDAARKQGGKQ